VDKILIDTNIVIHREASRVVKKDIGTLFRWLDNLHATKCIHPVTVAEINKLQEGPTRDSFNTKLENYNLLYARASLYPQVDHVCTPLDFNDNDRNDTLLIDEVYAQRVDALITEDRKIHKKAALLGIADRVFTIDAFLEKVTAENPGLADYKVLAVKKEHFGDIQVEEPFFDSLREDYAGFDRWFNRKGEETAYVCRVDDEVSAFLYLKVEDQREPYPYIEPAFQPRRRLKIGTFKVAQNGFKLGERFLKIAFDNAIRYGVDEIYVTIFDYTLEHHRLISLLEEYGFVRHGVKHDPHGGRDELIYVRSMEKLFNDGNPKLTYPFFSRSARHFLVPIYPEYHTNLFPDSILNTESPDDFVEDKPFSNAISKVYVSRSYYRDLRAGDVVVFYRTGGYYESVATTIGVVENIVNNRTYAVVGSVNVGLAR
jgi:predicted nucleic acid-binding protein